VRERDRVLEEAFAPTLAEVIERLVASLAIVVYRWRKT